MKTSIGLRALISAALIMALQAPVKAAEPLRIALTLDDGPHLTATARLSPRERNDALLAAMKRHGVQGTLFVTCGNGADRPEGLALARTWGEQGHLLGNHTMTHLDLHAKDVTLAQYQGEITQCQQILTGLPGLQRWFRFTYLREGNTPEKRDGMRDWLQAQGYRNAYVSLDTSDWRLNDLLEKTLAEQPQADITPIRDEYLRHLWQRAEAYQQLSQTLQGRQIPQVLLLHHNLINALWLDEVIAMFKRKGAVFVSAREAFEDPVYQLQPVSKVAGQSLLLSMARSLGLGRFKGWERLVDDGDAEMAALAQRGIALPPS